MKQSQILRYFFMQNYTFQYNQKHNSFIFFKIGVEEIELRDTDEEIDNKSVENFIQQPIETVIDEIEKLEMLTKDFQEGYYWRIDKKTKRSDICEIKRDDGCKKILEVWEIGWDSPTPLDLSSFNTYNFVEIPDPVKIEIDINYCHECPFHFQKKTEGAGFAIDYFCSETDKKIIGYVEHDEFKNLPIPNWCPYKTD